MSQFAAASEYWIPLIAVLWLVSVLVFIFSARRYFATRALEREDAALTSLQERFGKPNRTPPVVDDRDLDTGVEDAAQRVAEGHAITPLSDASDCYQAEAANAARIVATLPRKPAISAEGGFAAVRARISSDPNSAQGLSELIRALYLDESNFTFQTIARLSVEDRALAKGLIDEWLADPSAVERWEEIYETVRAKYHAGRWRESA